MKIRKGFSLSLFFKVAVLNDNRSYLLHVVLIHIFASRRFCGVARVVYFVTILQKHDLNSSIELVLPCIVR